MSIYFTEFSNYKDNVGTRKVLSLKNFFKYLNKCKYEGDKEQSPAISYFYNNTRKVSNLIKIITFFIYDIDVGQNLHLVQERLKDKLYYLYTTANHSELNHRFRVVIPVKELRFKKKIIHYEDYYKFIGDYYFDDFWDKIGLCHIFNIPNKNSKKIFNIGHMINLSNITLPDKKEICITPVHNPADLDWVNILNLLDQPKSHHSLLHIIRTAYRVFSNDLDEATSWFNNWILSTAKSGNYKDQFKIGYQNWIEKHGKQ